MSLKDELIDALQEKISSLENQLVMAQSIGVEDKRKPLTPDQITMCVSLAVLNGKADGSNVSNMTLYCREIEKMHRITE